VLHIHDLSSPSRLDLAAEQLETGFGFVFENTWFLCESGRLWCNAIDAGSGAKNEVVARDRIDESRRTLQRVRGVHVAIDRLVEQLPVSFAVVEDYGQGVAPLFCLVGDRLVIGDEAWRIWRRA
jgi:hypothetical protein